MSGTWRTVTLGDVIAEERHKRRVEPDVAYPLAGVLGFGRGVLLRDAVRGAEMSAQFLYRIRAGQLMYSRLKAFEGAFALVPPEADGRYVSNEFPTFDVDTSAALPEFLALYLARPRVWEELQAGSEGMGARRERLQPLDFLDLELDLPPVDEQRRVVEAVATARRDQEALGAGARTREQLYQAMLQELIDGDDVPLSDIVSRIEAGVSPKCLPRPPHEGEFGVLSTASVRHGVFRGRHAKALPPGLTVKNTARVRTGDLLTIRASGTRRLVGALCIVSDHVSRLLMSDYHWRLTPNEGFEPRYLMHATAAPEVRSQIDEAVTGSTTAGKVSRERYLAVEVPVPDLQAQRRVAASLDMAFAGVQAYRHAAASAGRVADALTEELVTGGRGFLSGGAPA